MISYDIGSGFGFVDFLRRAWIWTGRWGAWIFYGGRGFFAVSISAGLATFARCIFFTLNSLSDAFFSFEIHQVFTKYSPCFSPCYSPCFSPCSPPHIHRDRRQCCTLRSLFQRFRMFHRFCIQRLCGQAIHTYLYIHTHIHTEMHTHIQTNIHTYLHTHTYIHTYIHTDMHACMHTHMHVATMHVTHIWPKNVSHAWWPHGHHACGTYLGQRCVTRRCTCCLYVCVDICMYVLLLACMYVGM